MKRIITGLTVATATVIGTAAYAQPQTTPFCKITSIQTDTTWTYVSMPGTCFKQEKFQIRSDGSNNINLLAHLFTAHAGGHEVSVRWESRGFGPEVLGITSRPPS